MSDDERQGIDEPAVEEPAVEEPAVEEPAVEELTIEETAIGETKVDNNTADTAGGKRTDETHEDTNVGNMVNDEPEKDNDDDDFGSFSDASFDEFEEPPENTSVQQPESEKIASLLLSSYSDRDKLITIIDELTLQTFPDQLPTFTIPEDTSILNPRSQHLLERLIAPPHLKPYNWKTGSLRRQLLMTLGLPDDTIQKKERENGFDMSTYVVKTLEQLHIDDGQKKKMLEETNTKFAEIGNVITADDLLEMNDKELQMAIEKLEIQVSMVEKYLAVWDDEKTKLEEDRKTFESVVENLVGHTQRLRREETMKSLKKEKEKSKLNSLFKLKKN